MIIAAWLNYPCITDCFNRGLSLNRAIGYSTGSLSPGQAGLAIELLYHQEMHGQDVQAVEISALRFSELREALLALEALDLQRFQYVSFHAPSKLNGHSDAELREALSQVIAKQLPVILHPDAITDWGIWREIGSLAVIENMDGRKPAGRTVEELMPVFEQLPQARFCFDIGHAWQIDPTMNLTQELLLAFADRLCEFHVSEVNGQFNHNSISAASMEVFAPWLSRFPEVPIILETPVAEAEVAGQLQLVRAWC